MSPNQILSLLGVRGVTDAGGPGFAGYLARLDATGVMPLSALPNTTPVAQWYFIDAVNGSDIDGNGSVMAPFATIARAVTAIGAGTSALIALGPGVYAGGTFAATLQRLRIIGSGIDLTTINTNLQTNGILSVTIENVTTGSVIDLSIVGTPVYYVGAWAQTGAISSANAGGGGSVYQMPGASVSGVTNLTLFRLPLATEVGYLPTTPGDWLVVPSEAGGALDELAGRLMVLESSDLVSGPGAPVIADNLAAWDGIGAQLLKDSGLPMATVVNAGTDLSGGGAAIAIFKQRLAHALEFRGIIAGSNKLAVTQVAENASIDVNEANLVLPNMGGILAVPHGGSGVATLLGSLVGNGAAAFTALKLNYSAVVAPATTNDNTQGYAVGSRWFNIVTRKEYVCFDATTNLAVWKETTDGVGESNTASNLGAGAGLYSAKTGVDLQFKSLLAAGGGVSLLAATNTVTIEGRWQTIAASRYTASPATTSRIMMSDTTGLEVGLPVKYTYAAVTYVGMIITVTPSVSIDIVGAPLSLANPITELKVGVHDQVVQERLYVPGVYAAGIATILASIGKQYWRLNHGRLYLVQFLAAHKTPDSSTQPKLNVNKVGAGDISTADANNGIQLSTAGAWVLNSDVAIDASRYYLDRGDSLELSVTAAGGTGNAADLSVECTFVRA